jgi:hypothetical protein
MVENEALWKLADDINRTDYWNLSFCMKRRSPGRNRLPLHRSRLGGGKATTRGYQSALVGCIFPRRNRIAEPKATPVPNVHQ